MDFRVDFSGWACILLAMLCLVLPLDWLASAFLAAVVHEGCHILSVVCLGGEIKSLHIAADGAQLISSPMTLPRDLTAILAGPAGSLALLLLQEKAPQLALCGMVQGLFNLLPVYPLDGGRALHLLCMCFASEKTGRWIENLMTALTLSFLMGAGFWGTFGAKLGQAPVILSLGLLAMVIRIKKSCKEGIQRVQ